MPDILDQQGDRQRLMAVEVFLGALVTGSRTVQLYKPGHSIIPQIAERVINTLQAALGQEEGITLDVKAKSILFGETALTETPDVVSFAASLHMLGIGQVLFTKRLSKEGLIEFFRLLVLKPDEKKTLTDLQKEVQTLRIDGLQMIFILNFVVTGEQEQDQPPGKLSEEQILAYCAARDLPDFLMLLFWQSEKLHGKEVEAVTDLLDKMIHRDISLEAFEAGFPWDTYDPRIRQKWELFKAYVAWEPPRPGAPRRRWNRDSLVSAASMFDKNDLAALDVREEHEHAPSVLHGLAHSVALLEVSGERTVKYAIFAYVRLLGELARAGDVGRLLAEYDRWLALGRDPAKQAVFTLLQEQIRAQVPTQVFADRFIAHLENVEKDSPELARLTDFSVFLGEAGYRLLVDEMRRVQDKFARAKLATVLGGVARRLGSTPLLEALKDEDWFLVSTVVTIVRDLGPGEHARHLPPLLQHAHHRVREETVRALGKLGGADAADALAAFAGGALGEEEERCRAIITLSLLQVPELDRRLIALFAGSTDADIQIAAVRGLARAPTSDTLHFLKATARRTWYEIFTGLNKELRQAARESLEQLKKDGHA